MEKEDGYVIVFQHSVFIPAEESGLGEYRENLSDGDISSLKEQAVMIWNDNDLDDMFLLEDDIIRIEAVKDGP